MFAFEIEAKAGFVGLRKYLKELFGLSLVLDGDCKKLLSLLSPMSKAVGCGLINEVIQ